MPIPSEFIPAIGPIIAAVVAGAAAFLASVIAKENKVSEFRQAWIDALREDVSTLAATSRLVFDVIATMAKRGKSHAEIMDYLMENKEDISIIEITCARIQLRLNPDEHTNLMAATTAMLRVEQSIKDWESKISDQKSDQLIDECQKVLRSEWRRVKRGEPIFIATKWISMLSVVLAITLGILLANGALTF